MSSPDSNIHKKLRHEPSPEDDSPKKRKRKDMVCNIIQHNRRLCLENNALRLHQMKLDQQHKEIRTQRNWYKDQLDKLRSIINECMDDDIKINITPPFKELTHENQDEMDEKKERIKDCIVENATNDIRMTMDDIDKDQNNDNKDTTVDINNFGEYIPNQEMLMHPHHSNSIIYAKTRKSAPSKTLECYWVFPAQHQHKQSIIRIESNDYGLLTTNGAYLNDIIVDFQLKYSYASWPSSFKDKVYMFPSFFWQKLIKLCDTNEAEDNIKRVLRCTKHMSLFDKE